LQVTALNEDVVWKCRGTGIEGINDHVVSGIGNGVVAGALICPANRHP
jgi:hypothetical protein